MKIKMDLAKEQYAVAKVKAREKYDEGKLRMKGYASSTIVDNTPTGIVTNFENEHPL